MRKQVRRKIFQKERSDNMLEYEQYALELQGLEENITELRDSL